VGGVLRLAPVVAALGGAALLGCGPDDVRLPAIPMELVSVEAEYQSPTGTVPVDAIAQIAQLQSTLATIDTTHLPDIVTNMLSSLRARLDGSGLPTDPVVTPKKQRPVIVGSVTLTRTCRGWDETMTTPNPANGAIELTAEYHSSLLQKVVFGTATACHERVDVTDNLTVHTFLDGSLAVYLEGPLRSDPSQATYLVGWNGTIGTETAQASSQFDFRVVPPQLEVRLPVPDGNIIGSVGANQVSLRGKNGTFGCSLQTFLCSLPQVPGG
jgi:hypothetical protein